MRKFLSLTCLLYILSVNCILAQESIRFEHLKYDEIIEKSKREKKPVLIYFTGTGCYLCVKMEKNVFPKPEVSNFYNTNFITVESFDDFTKPDSSTKRLRRRFNIISNPTFIFTDSTGEVIHKSGYKETIQFLQVGQQAISNDNYKIWKEKIDGGQLDATLMLKYLSAEQKPFLFSETNYTCDAQTRLDLYFNSIPKKDFLLKDNWSIISNYVANPYSQVFEYLLNQEAEFSNVYGIQAVNEVVYKILADAWSGATESDAYKKAENYIRSLNHPLAKLKILQRDYLFQNKKEIITRLNLPDEAKKYIQLFDQNITRYPYLFSIYAVNDVATIINDQFKQNKEWLDKAKKWMELLLAIPANESYDFYATLAQTCFHIKDFKSAIDAQSKAIQLAINDELEKEELEQYQKKLTEYKHAASNR